MSNETSAASVDEGDKEMASTAAAPLPLAVASRVYPVMLIDAIVVKVRDSQVANRPVYVAIGVNLDGERDVLCLWPGPSGEGAKQWMSMLTELRTGGSQTP